MGQEGRSDPLGKEKARSRTCAALAAGAILFTLATPCLASSANIEYLLTHLTGDRWQYTYTVTNNAIIPGIEEFTIYFAFDSYDNLAIMTADPPSASWDELLVQPDPLLLDDGYYDALSLGSGIAVGESVAGFSVAFDWLGSGEPGPQAFDIVQPDPFEIIHAGTTTPEPAAMLLLAVALFVRRHPR